MRTTASGDFGLPEAYLHSRHGIAAGGLFGDGLVDVPVFDDPALVQAE
jgi:hypothetical protein